MYSTTVAGAAITAGAGVTDTTAGAGVIDTGAEKPRRPKTWLAQRIQMVHNPRQLEHQTREVYDSASSVMLALSIDVI